MYEIERKFLITVPIINILNRETLISRKRIEQSYLGGKTGEWTIRVRRITTDTVTHFITMKKKISMVRCVEIEHEIDAAFYEKMVSQCGNALCKTRYTLRVGKHVWELDVFDAYAGLVIAELELQDEQEDFIRPAWLGQEVTEDNRYKNRQLAKAIEEGRPL